MKKTYHFYHYVALLILLGLGMGFTLYFQFDRLIQALSIVGTSFAYLIWGVVHHLEEKSLHPRVFLEYFLLAVLGSSLLLSIVFRA